MQYNYVLAEQVIREIAPDVVRVQGPTTAETRNIEDGEIGLIGRHEGRKFAIVFALPSAELTEAKQRQSIKSSIAIGLASLGISQ